MPFNWKKTLYLVRGLPGEGKSSIALQLIGGQRRKLVENDDYWFLPIDKDRHFFDITENIIHSDKCILGPYVKKDGFEGSLFRYDYLREMTHLAADWCGSEAFRRLRIFDEVAVANTFVKRQHIIGYIEEARKLQVRILLYRPKTAWVGNIDECFAKNIHNVPLDMIKKMKDEWEEMTQDEVDLLLNVPVKFRMTEAQRNARLKLRASL